MTPVGTIDAICRFLGETLKDLRPDEKSVTVYPYSLPDPDPAKMMSGTAADSEPDDYEGMMPAVVVAPISFEDKAFEDGTSLLTVSLLAGVYSRDCKDGPLGVINILERVRLSLLSGRILEDACEVREPLNWQMYDDNTKPLWFGEMITHWRIAVPVRVDFEDWKGDLII